MPEWMTTKQVAEYLQVSESSIYRWVGEGRLPAYRIGGARRFKREDVDALAVPIVPPEGEADEGGEKPSEV